MPEILTKAEYEIALSLSRDRRMAWWRAARFGMFVHYGLYSALKRHEWAMAFEGWGIQEYEKLADSFCPKEGAPREWAKLAKSAGMKYMVLTTRHHEGFSLWDSKVNPFNSVNYGPKRDIVREYVDACREFGLKIGFYSSLVDWRHPDGGKAAYDSAARKRFVDYIYGLNEELLTNYGKIDILFFDVPYPMEHHEGWNAVENNQRLRALQPDIIINDRSRLDEDYATPEEEIKEAPGRDWESCMTFNGISWGYIDGEQARPYSYNAQRIIRMLSSVCSGGGNLLLNIGPAPDGSVPAEAVEPLKTVGEWLAQNGECVYGELCRAWQRPSGICSASIKSGTVYLWNWIWPDGGGIAFGGFKSKVRVVRILSTGERVKFKQERLRVTLEGLPEKSPDRIAGVSVLAFDMDGDVELLHCANIAAFHGGTTVE